MYYQNETRTSLREEMISSVNIPGSIELRELPKEFPEDKPFSVLLDTQIISSHARVSKNPFLRTFQYQFNIPLRVEYYRVDGSYTEQKINISSDDPLLRASLQSINIHGQEFIRIPLFSLKNFKDYESVKINFEESEEGAESTLYESIILLQEAEESLLLQLYLPFILIFSGIIIFHFGIFYFLIGFFHRNLEPGQKSHTLAIILSLLFGVLGFDRFYLGYPFLGILKGMTFGGLGFWYFYDLFKITSGTLKDSKNSELI